MSFEISKRRFLAMAAIGAIGDAMVGVPSAHAAEPELMLEWFDLIPKHSVLSANRDLDGRNIRIAGYMVPIEYDGTGTTEFLLVPYVGACVHVPPPPSNQIIMVKTILPYEVSGLFEPVYVNGKLSTEAISAEVRASEAELDGPNTVGFDVAYSLLASRIEPYEF